MSDDTSPADAYWTGILFATSAIMFCRGLGLDTVAAAEGLVLSAAITFVARDIGWLRRNRTDQ